MGEFNDTAAFMNILLSFFNTLWKQLAMADLASDYHPSRTTEQLKRPLFSYCATPKDFTPPTETLRYTPRLDAPVRSFSSYVRGYGTLPLKDRALITLRSARLAHAFHVIPDLTVMAIDHGLTDSDVTFIANGRYAPGWNFRQQLLIRVTDELYNQQKINRRVWKRLTKMYDHGQIFDIVLSAAAFHLCTF